MLVTHGNRIVAYLRLVALLSLVIWIVEGQPIRAAGECGDEFCDLEEDCTCQDCEECAPDDDNNCDSEWPQVETCQNNPWECEDLCVCGNSICEDDAEIGGVGSGNEYSQNPEARYCPGDCGGCDNDSCAWDEGLTCGGPDGTCTACSEFWDTCAYGFFCAGGSCVHVP